MNCYETKMHKTQWPDVKYAKTAPGLWRIWVEGAAVGPQYPTKEVLLSDLHRYVTDYGY